MTTSGDDATPGEPSERTPRIHRREKGKRKKNSAKPREAERVYARELLGEIPDDLESRRSPSTLNLPRWRGPNLETEYGRQCDQERRHFVDWLREQGARTDNVGALARALERHEASLAEGQAVPTHWVQLASRIGRGEIHDELGRAALREALEIARVEFRAAMSPKERAPAFAQAAE
jgi:hypothetical protein